MPDETIFQQALRAETQAMRDGAKRAMAWDTRIPMWATKEQVDAAFVGPEPTDEQMDAYLEAVAEITAEDDE